MQNGRRPNGWQWATFLLALVIFVAVTIGVVTDASWIKSFDQSIVKLVRFPQNPSETLIITWYTTFFNTVPTQIMVIIGASIFFIERYYKAALFFFLTPELGFGINKIIKAIVQRPRPQFDQLMHYGGYSFPSGHAIASTLILGCIIVMICGFVTSKWYRRTINSILMVMILLVGFSRIYVGVHYPSDVLAGFCLGYIILFVSQTIFGFHHFASVKTQYSLNS